jgi:hypothetical protein
MKHFKAEEKDNDTLRAPKPSRTDILVHRLLAYEEQFKKLTVAQLFKKLRVF